MKKFALISILLFTLFMSAANALQIRSGYYVGTGVARSITGVGIQPDLVTINCDTATGRAVWRSSTMGGDSTAYFDNAVANEVGLIRSLDIDGFSLGTNAQVNARNVRYTWTAYSGSGAGGASKFYVGSYTGHGDNDRNILDPGFQPDVVWIKRDGTSQGVWYSSVMPVEPAAGTQYFSATAPAADRIQNMQTTGFQVGTNSEVNQNGDTYHYVAFKATAEASLGIAVGSYTGDGAIGGRSIAGVGFRPDRVMIKRAGASNAVFRNTSLYGDETANFTQAANVINCIMAFENDGFQIGSDARVNTAANIYYYAAFKGVPDLVPVGNFKTVSGNYSGNGSSQSISGLPWKPDLVIIKADTNQLAVFTSAMMAPNTSAYLGAATANFADGIVSLDNNGFTIGSNATVNSSGVTYRWSAFYGHPCTNFIIGAYSGLGGTSDNRSITGFNFKPDLVTVKRDGASLGVWRTSTIIGDATAYFSATADTADRVQSLEADGFQIGNNAEVNTAAATNFYFAFKNTSGQFTTEAYTGNNIDSRSIGGLGLRPGLVWIKRPELTSGAVQRSYALGLGDTSQYFIATANAANLIQALESNGFQVGNDVAVNANLITYRYAAWKANSTTLSYVQQPTSAVAGAAISPAITVSVKDDSGNIDTTDNSTQVRLSIKNNPGGVILKGTTLETVSAGTATFSNISIEAVGIGYTLEAISSGFTTANSTSFNITAAAANKLGFTIQPSQTIANQNISPAVKVAVMDQFGNTITSDNATNIHVKIKTGAGTLSGTTTKTVVSGVASFDTLSIDTAGAGYTLNATCDSYTLATSDAFSIIPAAATTLRFVSSYESNALAGAILGSLTVEVTDGINVVSDNSTQVTIAIFNNPGSGTLSGTLTRTVSGGRATFEGLSINKTGTGYTLKVTAGSLQPATTEAFNITPGTANKLALTVQPTDAMAGTIISPFIKVSVQDALDNLVTTNSGTTVAIAIYNNAGGGLLYGNTSRTTASGEVTFNNLYIDKIGSGYTLIPNASGLIAFASNAFNITLAPSNKLAFYVQPLNTVAGQTITPSVQIAVQDQYGNIISGDNTSEVTLSIGTNPGSGTLSGTVIRTVAAGIATFDDLNINKIGTGYTLVAASTGKASSTSNGFNITHGAANKVVFTTQPSNTTAGQNISPAVKTELQDTLGNLVSSDSTSIVTIEISSNPAGGTLSGTKTQTVASGIATFSDLNINKAGNSYTLSAASAGLAGDTSSTFNITPASPTKLVYLVQPSRSQAGYAITPEIKVALEDQYSNIASQDSTTQVTMSLTSAPGGGMLFGTKTRTAASGVAIFNDLRINKKGDGYTVEASAASLTPATSDAFSIFGEPPAPAVTTLSPTRDAVNVPHTANLVVGFNQPMDTGLTTSAFSLKAIADNNGVTFEPIAITGTSTWDSNAQILTFTPASLNKGFKYQADLAATAKSADLVAIASAESWTFVITLDHTKPNTTFSADHRASVTSQAGSFPTDGYVDIDRDPRNDPKVVDPAKITLAVNKTLAEGDPFHYPIQSSITEFNFFDLSGTRVSTTFAVAVTVALYYDDTNNDGIVDGTSPPIHEKDLTLCRLDETNGLWVKIPGSDVNLLENYVYAPINSFSVYTIMANPALSAAQVYSYPNPYKPSAGHTTITFTNLPSACEIKVFNVSGDLARTLNETDGDGQYIWDVKNSSGELLQSGLYLYIVKSATETKTGKLVIIR